MVDTFVDPRGFRRFSKSGKLVAKETKVVITPFAHKTVVDPNRLRLSSVPTKLSAITRRRHGLME